MVDLIIPDMVDFNSTLGMDFFSLYYDILDYHAKIDKLVMLGMSRVSVSYVKLGYISRYFPKNSHGQPQQSSQTQTY